MGGVTENGYCPKARCCRFALAIADFCVFREIPLIIEM